MCDDIECPKCKAIYEICEINFTNIELKDGEEFELECSNCNYKFKVRINIDLQVLEEE